MAGSLNQAWCSHTFLLKDLRSTNIPELPKPKTNDYFEWQKYYAEIYDHPSVTRRVMWPCSKCGKVFYAAYGLAIAPHQGEIIPEPKSEALCTKSAT